MGLTILFVAYFLVDKVLFDGVKALPVNEAGFQANYFAKETTANETAVVLIGGGQWGDYWAQEFANKDMAGLSIPYTGRKGLTPLPEEIDLMYFENAIDWLKEQPHVDPDKIVVMGASRNAELALVLASMLTESISGVVAYAPSSVSWCNRVLPYNSDELKASWKYRGRDIPYVPMDKIAANESKELNMLAYWKSGLEKVDSLKDAIIQVERINGSILLFSGNDDRVWPSAQMADRIEKRLSDSSFSYSFHNIKYDNAGHSISTNPDDKSDYQTGNLQINGVDYDYEFGGTAEGNFKAKQDAKIKLMEYLKGI